MHNTQKQAYSVLVIEDERKKKNAVWIKIFNHISMYIFTKLDRIRSASTPKCNPTKHFTDCITDCWNA